MELWGMELVVGGAGLLPLCGRVALASAVWFGFVRFIVLCCARRAGKVSTLTHRLGLPHAQQKFWRFFNAATQQNKTNQQSAVENFQRALSILLFSLRFRVFFGISFLVYPA